MHRMPEFVFKLDTSIKKQAQVLDAIARANAEHADEEDTTEPPHTNPGDDQQ